MISSTRITGMAYAIKRAAFTLLTVVFLAGAATGADNEVAKIIPADSLFCVQINNLDFTLSQTDQYLSGILPPMMGTQMGLRMGLAQILGNPSLEGVNTGGSLAVFANAGGSKSFKEMLTIVIPVADYQKLVSSSPNLEPPDANGISTIKNIGGFVMQVGNFVFVKPPPAGYNSLLAMKKSAAGAEFKSLASSLDSASAAQSASSPVWLYCNMPEVEKTFGPQVEAAFEDMKNEFKRMPPGAFGTSGSLSDLMNIYFDIVKGFMSQSKSVTLTIKPQPDCLSAGITVSALPGTKMAEMFVPDATKKENKLRPYMQNGAMLNYSGSSTNKSNSEVMKLYADFFSKKLTPEKTAKIQALVNDSASIFNGSDAVSASIDPNGKPPFSETIISEISDKDKFNKMVDQGVELVNGGVVDDIYKSMGLPLQFSVTLKRGAANYNGVSIDSAVASFKFPDVNSPEAQMIKQMYGDGLTYRWAIVNNLFVCAIGSDNDAKLKKLIDQVKSGGPTQVCSEVKDAMAVLPGSEKANFIATFNLVRCFDFIPMVMPMMPKMNIPTKSNLVIAGRIDNGSVTVDIALPKAHLMEIVQAFQGLVQAGMQGAGMPVQGTGETGGPQPQQLKAPPTKPADANSKK
jgi:hypothetical protein